ncbi:MULTISPECIES: hypothetical protein [unclassified Bradyrhizobium]|uniref:hypothetical protein n=1 Tax=unclassified Bradyrhizobium TaxID=2631580 RepID=UPI00068661A3|nr:MULTISPECIES: hypothetical protein [unclassified Bradyrhizobium]QIG96340.1 hypothetical protein G6P99_30685 [Bradyrhizobium sp. 6(2017)]
MSDESRPINPDGSPPSPPPRLPPQRGGCATAFMALFGVALLLPGACALLFGFGAMTESRPDPSALFLILLGLAVGFAGVMLIRAAIKGS